MAGKDMERRTENTSALPQLVLGALKRDSLLKPLRGLNCPSAASGDGERWLSF